MKTATKFFPLMLTLFIVSMAANVNAQGRGHHKGHDREHRGQHHHKDHHWKHDRKGHHHNYDRRRLHVVHHHDRYCHHAPVVVHDYHPGPRYVYYRDYDVYYDTHNSVYISYSGRHWTISANLPVVLHRVDVHRAVRMEVDYQRDDLPRYLERSRPAYRRVYAGS